MEASHQFILLILLISNIFLIQGLLATNLVDENLSLEKQLEIINKPATKSFTTRYGDILDCVDINKQYAFDHPLLKNHTIQMKPTFARQSSLAMTSQNIPKHMICPQGTVPVKRILKEDLLAKKFTPIFSSIFNNVSKSVSNSVDGHDAAGIVANFKNLGVSATLDVWNPQVKEGQYSDASIYVGSEDGPVSNVIQTGWMVSPAIFPKSYETRFFAYWTKDSGKSSGCYNMMCPGFVQVSKTVSLGQVISPVSKTFGKEVLIDMQIRQDIVTKNWWLSYGGENVGYWPAALFTTLTAAATRAGWGGEVYSPPSGQPEMGSGFRADSKAGYLEVSYMKNLQMLAPELFPKREDLFFGMSSPDTYNVIYKYDSYWFNNIYFGGPKSLH